MSWSGVGSAYARSYAGLCAGTGERMQEIAGPAAGRSLLDVGAGDGMLAAAWADAGWRVTACDPEASMREEARRQHPQLKLLCGALPALPFSENEYDVVAANFVLNHLDDPRAGAAELRRVARSLVIATIWTRSPSLWATVTARAGLAPASGGRLPADKDFERTTAGFDRMLRDAGWRPEVEQITWTWRPSAEMLWTSVEGGVAGAGSFYLGLAEAARASFRRAFVEVTSKLADGDAVPMAQTAAIAVDRQA